MAEKKCFKCGKETIFVCSATNCLKPVCLDCGIAKHLYVTTFVCSEPCWEKILKPYRDKLQKYFPSCFPDDALK